MQHDLNGLSKTIFNNNQKKGFYDEINATTRLLEYKPLILEAYKHTVTAQRIALIVSEASEALEADRKNSHCKLTKTAREILLNLDGERFTEIFKKDVKDTVEDEIADTIIRCLDFCGANGIDIDFHIQAKMRYNGLRPYKHGKIY